MSALSLRSTCCGSSLAVCGWRLDHRRDCHGDYHHRAALGAGRAQYRALHAASVRAKGCVAGVFGSEDLGTGPIGVLGNIVWLVLAGWWFALGHLITAILLAVTVVGIPFAWAHLKLAGVALWPIGKIIVPTENTTRRP